MDSDQNAIGAGRWRRRNAGAIGLINLIYNLACYEQIVWLKLLPRNAA